MTDNELLLAISNMMDTKLEPVNKEIQELKGDKKGYKNCLNLALKNDTSLSFNKYAVMKEFKECPQIEEEKTAEQILPAAEEN